MRVPVGLLGGVLTCAILPRSAAAADGEWVIAAEPGYALLVSDDVSQHGGGGTASGWLGLTDTLWLGISGGAFALAKSGSEPAVTPWEAMGGLVAALDVFRWIPYVEGYVGLLGQGSTLAPTLRLGLGIDYLVSPSWFVGAVLRSRPFIDPIANVETTISLRVGVRFEL